MSMTQPRTSPGTLALRAAGALALALLLGGCGDGDDQPSARARAAKSACAKTAACGEIGAGKRYATRESCEVDQNAFWENAWPPAECDGKINQSQLDLCIQAIDTAQCGNAFDLANILLNRCPKAKICAQTP